jgi:hypothetical protein
MRKAMWVYLALAAAAAFAWPPAIVGSFAAPVGILDVGYEGGYVYALLDGAPPRVYELNANSGSIYRSFTIGVPTGARGLTVGNFGPTSYLAVSNSANRYIYYVTTAGSLQSSFYCPVGAPYGLGGGFFLEPDYGYLCVACRDQNRVLNLNRANGSLVSSFAGPASAVICYDGWLAADANTNYLYWNYYGSWQTLATMPARPTGLDTSIQWPTRQLINAYVACANGYVYHFNGYTAIEPASLGRVRATFW